MKGIHRWIPLTKRQQSFDFVFVVNPNMPFTPQQSRCLSFVTSCRSHEVIVMHNYFLNTTFTLLSHIFNDVIAHTYIYMYIYIYLYIHALRSTVVIYLLPKSQWNQQLSDRRTNVYPRVVYPKSMKPYDVSGDEWIKTVVINTVYVMICNWAGKGNRSAHIYSIFGANDTIMLHTRTVYSMRVPISNVN